MPASLKPASIHSTVMTVSFEIPTDIEELLRSELGDLGTAAREALLVEGYRHGAVSLGRLAELLRIAVAQAPTWLATRGVPLNYGASDLLEDERTLDTLLGHGTS
jgi:predicted HTH domain antitoxin